ncbi:hypothetical protein [Bradyrhizobium cenepequi]|uniref:hypothetical protein n=1 Tax=Bradyrhizobium cenepequi TaxID=2821403 RepID=UPI001CE2DCC0|nr:hypothetical protein [Bradyrhizobium cenepequi]MCA6108139.1 hypothetical protein [Bradyrhizobium cenepequi]
MSAIFWVRFDNGQTVSVSSADAKSMKRADLTAATRKAITKAKAKLARQGVKAKPVACNCVG